MGLEQEYSNNFYAYTLKDFINVCRGGRTSGIAIEIHYLGEAQVVIPHLIFGQIDPNYLLL